MAKQTDTQYTGKTDQKAGGQQSNVPNKQGDLGAGKTNTKNSKDI